MYASTAVNNDSAGICESGFTLMPDDIIPPRGLTAYYIISLAFRLYIHGS
jgi:hypothetical protein